MDILLMQYRKYKVRTLNRSSVQLIDFLVLSLSDFLELCDIINYPAAMLIIMQAYERNVYFLVRVNRAYTDNSGNQPFYQPSVIIYVFIIVLLYQLKQSLESIMGMHNRNFNENQVFVLYEQPITFYSFIFRLMLKLVAKESPSWKNSWMKRIL